MAIYNSKMSGSRSVGKSILRTERGPLDKYTVFDTYADARNCEGIYGGELLAIVNDPTAAKNGAYRVIEERETGATVSTFQLVKLLDENTTLSSSGAKLIDTIIVKTGSNGFENFTYPENANVGDYYEVTYLIDDYIEEFKNSDTYPNLKFRDSNDTQKIYNAAKLIITALNSEDKIVTFTLADNIEQNSDFTIVNYDNNSSSLQSELRADFNVTNGTLFTLTIQNARDATVSRVTLGGKSILYCGNTLDLTKNYWNSGSTLLLIYLEATGYHILSTLETVTKETTEKNSLIIEFQASTSDSGISTDDSLCTEILADDSNILFSGIYINTGNDTIGNSIINRGTNYSGNISEYIISDNCDSMDLTTPMLAYSNYDQHYPTSSINMLGYGSKFNTDIFNYNTLHIYIYPSNSGANYFGEIYLDKTYVETNGTVSCFSGEYKNYFVTLTYNSANGLIFLYLLNKVMVITTTNSKLQNKDTLFEAICNFYKIIPPQKTVKFKNKLTKPDLISGETATDRTNKLATWWDRIDLSINQNENAGRFNEDNVDFIVYN